MKNSPILLKEFWEVLYVGPCLWNMNMSYCMQDAAFPSVYKLFS